MKLLPSRRTTYAGGNKDLKSADKSNTNIKEHNCEKLEKQSIIKCFAIQKDKRNISSNPISPEYKMSTPRQTRQTSKRQGSEQDLQEENFQEESSDTYSGLLPCQLPIEDKEAFKADTAETQMDGLIDIINQLCVKITEIDININHDSDGMNTRITTAQTQSDQAVGDVAQLHTDVTALNNMIGILQNENSILKGVIRRHSTQLKSLNDKVAMLTACSMEKNITISGIEEENKENCKEKVVTFLKQKVEIDAETSEILVAHRIGHMNKAKKHRLMLVWCKFHLKERIFKNVKNLKDKKNSEGSYYYINKQLPEKIAKENHEIRKIIKEQKAKDSELPPKDKSKIEVINKIMHIDGEPVFKQVTLIETHELFPDKAERDKQDKIKLATSDTTTIQGSTFIG